MMQRSSLMARPSLLRPRVPSLLGLGSSAQMRCFSTTSARVFSNAIFMPELFPARLPIPSEREGVPYDFTLDNQTTVNDFQQRVLDNTDNDISSF